MAMPPAGYSGKSVADKLGAKPNTRWLSISAPWSYRAMLGEMPRGLLMKTAALGAEAEGGPFQVVHLFATTRADLEAGLTAAASAVAPGGALWVSWPKKSSRLHQDLTEDGVRTQALPLGLVDVKVCALDADWSGLKLVMRKAG